MAKPAGWQIIPVEIQTKILRLALFLSTDEVTEFYSPPRLQQTILAIDRATRQICHHVLERDFVLVSARIHECIAIGRRSKILKKTLQRQYSQTLLLESIASNSDLDLSRLDVDFDANDECKQKHIVLSFSFIADETSLLDFGLLVAHRLHGLCTTQHISFFRYSTSPQTEAQLGGILSHLARMLQGCSGRFTLTIDSEAEHLGDEDQWLCDTICTEHGTTGFLGVSQDHLDEILRSLKEGTPVHELLFAIFRATDQYHQTLAHQHWLTFDDEEALCARRLSGQLVFLLYSAYTECMLRLPNSFDRQCRALKIFAGKRDIVWYLDEYLTWLPEAILAVQDEDSSPSPFVHPPIMQKAYLYLALARASMAPTRRRVQFVVSEDGRLLWEKVSHALSRRLAIKRCRDIRPFAQPGYMNPKLSHYCLQLARECADRLEENHTGPLGPYIDLDDWRAQFDRTAACIEEALRLPRKMRRTFMKGPTSFQGNFKDYAKILDLGQKIDDCKESLGSDSGR
ncbi:hypothetical protein PMZ80_000506 [Knufia obscura]|uniref:Uncharacterized protein n=2 Tax=Knufia TaxID=430999 RepID=A0AAN8EUY8_9EURO|nr:hypothetical protein PMZ80_000506 [Knufia obscura]KAK5956565.1 hypothetical protein OHC33_002050 [Knufia fluminis]